MYNYKIVRFLLTLLLVVVCTNPGFSQDHKPGENPIFRNIFTADPAPLVYNDTLFVFAGHDEAGEGQMFNITEWVVYSTTDMKEWTYHGPIMEPTDFEWAVSDAWASQVIEKNGKFYFYTTVQHGPPHNSKAVGVAVADHPLGPYKDAKGSALVYDAMTPTPEDPHDWDDIDPTVFTDDEGATWVSWGNMHLYLAKLKPNMIEFDGPIQEIYLPNYTEGPWIHKREETYYLTSPCFAHQNMYEKICYAMAPQITGPWTYKGILTDRTKNSYTIHPGIIEYKGQWYFFYHNAQHTIDGVSGAIGRRSVTVEYMYYNEDGTIKPITQTKEGISGPPNPPSEYKAPIFHPDAPLVTVESDISVTQNKEGVAANTWKGNPKLSTMGHPYDATTASESFNRAENGATRLGQAFTIDKDFILEDISLYVGDGFGTTEDNPVTLALYEIDNSGSDSYNVKKNLLGSTDGMQINYKPQGRGIIQLRLAEDRQPLLEADKTYVLELQGVRGSAPLFWRRTGTDQYSEGAAYQDRSLIKNESNTVDFGMALFGSNQK